MNIFPPFFFNKPGYKQDSKQRNNKKGTAFLNHFCFRHSVDSQGQWFNSFPAKSLCLVKLAITCSNNHWQSDFLRYWKYYQWFMCLQILGKMQIHVYKNCHLDCSNLHTKKHKKKISPTYLSICVCCCWWFEHTWHLVWWHKTPRIGWIKCFPFGSSFALIYLFSPTKQVKNTMGLTA